MAKPINIPNVFAAATSAIPLSQLDQDFSTLANATNDLATYSNYVADTGAANAFIANYPVNTNTASLTTGLRLQFKAANANTGASTLNVQVNGGSIGTAAIRLTDGSALPANTIIAGAMVDVMYDGTNFQLMNDPSGGQEVITNLSLSGNLTVAGTSTFTGNVTGNVVNTTTSTITNLSSGNVTITGGTISNVTLDNVTVDVETFSNITINGTASFAAGTVSAPSITTTGDTNTGIYFPAADTIAFTEGGVESMRITSAGNVGIGTTSLTGYNLRIRKNATGATSAFGIAVDPQIQSDVTGAYYGVISAPSTQAASFTLSSIRNFEAQQGTFGASSVVTNQYGFLANAGLTGATNNFGFYSNIASGTGRWNFYANGTAQNYFAGQTLIGSTTAVTDSSTASRNFQVTGTTGAAGQYIGRYSNDVNPSALVLGKSRGTSVGTNTVVASGDTLGRISFDGADGTNLIVAATIQAEVDGTPGTNDMPGRLVFSTTADGAAGTTERMRIDSSGRVLIGTTNFGGGLTLAKSDTNFRNGTNAYPYPSGNSYLQVDASSTNSQNNWIGLIGEYGVSTGSANILLQANFNNTSQQSGNYIGSEATSATSAVLTFGRMIGGSTTSTAATKSEAMRITSGGEVYIAGTTDQGAYNLQVNGTGVWGAGAYVNGSDERIKENISPIESGLDVVEKLNPVTYRYKEEWSKDQSTQTGFIAQELLTALDGQIYVDGVVQQGGEYMSVAYQNIIPILTKAIQELNAKVVELEAKLNAK